MLKEIRERRVASDSLKSLPIDSLDHEGALLELAESLENAKEITEIYRIRKKATGSGKKSGINLEEAGRLKNCFSQGRELYLAGKQGSLMVKPLNFFYSITAYSYGVIVLNNPVRYSKGNIPGSHGMSYLPDEIQAQFGGDSARGTFSDLVTAFPTQLIKTPNIEINIDCSDSLFKFYHNKFSVSLGTLMSMIPEMSDYYQLTMGRKSKCHPLEITNRNDPRSLTWDFNIGDGESRPSASSIEESFPGFETSERYGKTVVSLPADRSDQLKACIYTDTHGKLWFVENPFFPIILPEISVHFLITSMFSNIMRYRPDEWGNLINNQVDSKTSLLTRHYFSSFQRKFFIIVLRSMSRYIPYVS
jgi:hypothetical protein